MTAPPNPPPAPEPAPDPWPVPEVDDLDLAASALLDQVGSDSGSDQPAPDHGVVAESPSGGPAAVEARAAELGAVVEALAEPVYQPDTTIRDDQVRQALASRRLTADPADDPTPDRSGVLDSGGGRSTRSGAHARRWLAVAAAIGLVLVGGLALARLASSHGGGVQTASVAGSAAATTTTPPGAQPDAALPQAGGQSSPSVAQLPDLGSFANADALLARVGKHQANGRFGGLFGPTSTVAGPAASATEATLAGVTCEATVRAGRQDLGPLDQVARASVAGQTVEVLLFGAGPAPADAARVVAVRPADCQVVVDRTA